MSDLTFSQQLLVTGLQVVGVGGAVVLGAVLLRRQERVKREEEHTGALRRLQSDALLRVLSTLGRYHSQRARLRSLQKAHANRRGVIRDDERDELRDVTNRLDQLHIESIETIADTTFLLGNGLSQVLRRGLTGMVRAEDGDQQEDAANHLSESLIRWIPSWLPRCAK